MLLSFKRHTSPRAGFSLLELLVVISIIGILMAMGAVAYSTTQKKTRDSRRRADVQQTQKAFEQYYADNAGYDACATMATSSYMPSGLPVDPQTDAAYTCTGATSSYCLCATLEETGTGNASDTGCTYATDGDYFCVSNLQ